MEDKRLKGKTRYNLEPPWYSQWMVWTNERVNVKRWVHTEKNTEVGTQKEIQEYKGDCRCVSAGRTESEKAWQRQTVSSHCKVNQMSSTLWQSGEVFELGVKKKSLCYKLVLTSVRSVVLGKAIKAFWSSFFSCIKLEISKCIIIQL